MDQQSTTRASGFQGLEMKMTIINLTQHAATAEQLAAGVFDVPNEGARRELLMQLTFGDLPEDGEIVERAAAVASIAMAFGARAAMIGGAPYLMSALERELREGDITPLYAFSRRESVEEKLPDGSVRKVAVFRHLGFVEGTS